MQSRKRIVQRIFSETYCELAPSPIHGVGVFAVRLIPQGIDPFVDGSTESNSWVEVKSEELRQADAGIGKVILNLFVPTEGRVMVPVTGTNLINIGSYLNHSEQPNVATRDGNCFRATRPIAAGEELTVDYRTFGAAHLLEP